MTLIKHGTAARDLPETFGRLLTRLRAFTVKGWEYDSDGPTWPKLDREVAMVGDADVVSSAWQNPTAFDGTPRRHVVALDIDYPAYLVESSTPGHHHLYLDVPGGVAHDDYMSLLQRLGALGVIQPGYAKVSQERGHSDLRLPWVPKRPADGGAA